MIKYIIFYFLFTAWLGYYKYLKFRTTEPKTRRQEVLRKRIKLLRERAISEVYVMTGDSKEDIEKELENAIKWSSILFSWYTIPKMYIKNTIRFFKRLVR